MPSWIETATVQAMSVVLKGGTLNSNKIVCGILRFKQVQIYLLWLKCGHRNGINRYTPHACSPSPLTVFLRNPRGSQSSVYLGRLLSVLETRKANRTSYAKIKHKYVTCTMNFSGQWT